MMVLRNKANYQDHSFFWYFLVLMLFSALMLILSARPIAKIIMDIVEETTPAAVGVAAEVMSLSSFQLCPVDSRTLEPKDNTNNLNGVENKSFLEPTSYENDGQEAVVAAAALSDNADTVRFLFAGQSNMVGKSGGANATQFIDLVKVINEDWYKIVSYSSPQKQQQKKKELFTIMKHIIMAGKQVTEEAAEYESKTLSDLAGNDKAISILNNELFYFPILLLLVPLHNRIK